MVWLTKWPHLSDNQALDPENLVGSVSALEAGGWISYIEKDMSSILSREVVEEINKGVESVASLLEEYFDKNKWSLWNEKSGITGSQEYYDMLAKIIEENLLNKYSDGDVDEKDYLLRCLDNSLKNKWLHLHWPSKVYPEKNVGPNWWSITEDKIVKYRISEVE